MMPTRSLLLAALLLAAGAGAAQAGRPARRAPLPWIADDYTRAVAQAKARKVPIFVEAWAPW